MERYAKPCCANHGQVVGTVAHGNGLRQVHLFHLCDELQQLSLTVTVHNLTHVTAGELAVVAHFELIGIDVIDAVLALKLFAKERESAREDCNLIPAGLQYRHQTVHTFGDGQVVSYVLHDAHVEAFQQTNAPCEALLEVNLAAHGTLGDGSHLCTHAGTLRQFVDALGLNECGVHVETYQSAHSAEHVVALQREVYAHDARHLHHLSLHLTFVVRLATQRELYACPHVLGRVLYALPARQTKYAVNVQPLVGNDAGGSLNLARLQLPAHDHQYVAVLTLMAHPVLVFIVADGRETYLYSQFSGFEQQFFHYLTRVHLVHAHEYSERQCGVNVGLSDVEYLCIVTGQYRHYRCCQSGAVLSCYAY